MSNDSPQRETTKLKIWAANGKPEPSYSNFKVLTMYVGCIKSKIPAKLFLPFSWWLDRARRVVLEKVCFKF